MKMTASIMTLLLIVNVMLASVVISTAHADIIEVNDEEGYTEYYGSLCGANFYILIPDDWTHELGDGMLVLICRPGSYVEDPREYLKDFTFAQALAMDGIAVAASNYGPNGDIKEGVLHTQRLTLYVLENYCVTGKVFLFGTSTGGAVALLLGERHPNIFSGVLDNSGVKDPAFGYHDAVSYSGSDPFLLFWHPMMISTLEMRYGGTPDEKSCEYAEDSPLHHTNMKIPVLSVIHADDTVIQPYHTELYHEALSNPCLHEVVIVTDVTPGAVPWFPNATGWYGHFDPIAYDRAQDELTTLICWSNTLDSEACPETCPEEPACPEEPECPKVCPEDPVCPKECPEEPVCPKEPACPQECPEEPICPDEDELSVTYFEGYGYFDVTVCPNPDDRDATLLQKCGYNLTKGGKVQFRHHWEPFGEGINVNTLNTVSLTDGTRYMWGTNVIEFCGVTLSGYTTVIMWPDGSRSFQYVNYDDNMLVLWNPSRDGLNVSGVIIEGHGIDDYACAWPDVNWNCGSEATPFTGWAEGAAPPDFGPVIGTMDDIELVEGTKIHYYHTWDSSCWVNTTFGLGRIVNTFNSVNNMTDASSIMWGTHELTFDSVTLTGTVTAHRWMDEIGNGVTTGSWVGAGDGYLVIWHYDSRLERQDYGVIIEL
jgi:hypothetical protein